MDCQSCRRCTGSVSVHRFFWLFLSTTSFCLVHCAFPVGNGRSDVPYLWSQEDRQGIGLHNITFREQRFLPLLVLVGVNMVGYELMKQIDAPRFLSAILLFNAVNTVFILLVTLQWKISIHLFSLTSSIALLVLFYGVQPLWLLLFVPLLMWSRIHLKAHNFMQTLVGSLIGFLLMYGEFKWWLSL
jgi:membrane-associated phospholipid phosphatase